VWIAWFKDAEVSDPDSRDAVPRAITITSEPLGSVLRAPRNHSRIRRFTRLRTTALPTRLLTVTPRRTRSARALPVGQDPVFPVALRANTTTKSSDAWRLPARITRRKSCVRKSRSARRKRPVFERTALLRGNTGCEALSTFRAASLDDRAAGSCLHSLAEPMHSLAPDSTRLIGTFHRRPSIVVVDSSLMIVVAAFEGMRGSMW